MYSDNPVLNQLTALMVAHGIRHVVVCPGARNAALVHNFRMCPAMTCHPVTDERSAAFVAVGLAQALEAPVAVCVTSGSAVLDTLPAVAEACYQHVPLLVISADRPRAWIDQLDGQTIPQEGVLKPFAKRSVQLSEADDAESRWYNNRVLNDVLSSLSRRGGQVAHVNVPLHEPLFQFSTPELPQERVVRRVEAGPASAVVPEPVAARIRQAHLPLLVVGQLPPDDRTFRAVDGIDRSGSILVLPEDLSNCPGGACNAATELGMPAGMADVDLVIHLGGNSVNKALKLYLRAKPIEVIRVDACEELVDTFGGITLWWESEPSMAAEALCALAQDLPANPRVSRVRTELDCMARKALLSVAEADVLTFDSTLAQFGHCLQSVPYRPVLQLANSRVVRRSRYIDKGESRIFCNRGVNGIEGSLSTAVGYSLAVSEPVFCLIGDLSFFYDVNALWNVNKRGNLRVLLLNDGGGGIFRQLPHLEESQALAKLVAASHDATARGVAEAFGLRYLQASTPEELARTLVSFTAPDCDVPLLLEVRC